MMEGHRYRVMIEARRLITSPKFVMGAACMTLAKTYLAEFARRDMSAIRIQKVFRGHAARRRYKSLKH
jgi:hypothetical protein